MKRFHFETIHLIMIGLILFGIATIFVRVLQTESALIFALFIIMVVVVALCGSFFEDSSWKDACRSRYF